MNGLGGNPARRRQEFSCGKEVKGEEVGLVGGGGGVKRGRVLCTISCDYILFDGVYPVGSARAENSMRGQDETSTQFFSSLLRGGFS